MKFGLSRAWSRLLAYTLFQGRPLTTRGRWANHLLRRGANSVMSWQRHLPVEKPIFIIGMGRTGTTVLGEILSVHPRIGYLNEPKLLWHMAYPDEDLHGNYTSIQGRYCLAADDAANGVTEKVRRLHGLYLALAGRSRLLDKYPELLFRIPFVQKIYPDAKFVVIVRNGDDTINSIAKWSRTHKKQYSNGVSADWWGANDRKWVAILHQLVARDIELAASYEYIKVFKDDINKAAVEWLVTMNEALALMASNERSGAILLKYEDLIAFPRETLERLLAFLELEPDERLQSYAEAHLRKSKSGGSRPILHNCLSQSFAGTSRRLGY